MAYKSKPVIERLFQKVTIPTNKDGTYDHNQCWIWNGATLNSGYGLIRLNEEEGMRLVHRVVQDHYLPFDPKLEVQHNCGNKLCVNPSHLTTGNPSTRYQVYNKPTVHWTKTRDCYKTCPDCGISTYILWFNRKHKHCGK